MFAPVSSAHAESTEVAATEDAPEEKEEDAEEEAPAAEEEEEEEEPEDVSPSPLLSQSPLASHTRASLADKLYLCSRICMLALGVLGGWRWVAVDLTSGVSSVY